VNPHAPFQPSDLEELDELLDQADLVVAMEDVHDGTTNSRVVGMRHDVDNEIESSVLMAQWEAERGYRSSYYVLHTAPYWQQKDTLRAALEIIHECGHEIGFHLNAITEAIETGRDPLDIAQEAVDELRGYGYPVRGVTAHGDRACHEHHFINDELFTESRRPGYGAADRVVGGVKLAPVSRSELGFDYDPAWLTRGVYLSDSGGRWNNRYTSESFESVASRFPLAEGQLHILQHPCWWANSFAPNRIAA
jgi:hypothetical protein